MSLTGKARVAAVLGWPVGHSRSPCLHGHWLARHRIDGAYVPLAVRPESFAQAFRALPALGLAGCNVTVPHKEMALALCDEVDAAARAIGAVNTVVVREDRLIGSNSDAFGFFEHLRQEVPEWPSERPAVVLGAGGAARAVVWRLLQAGVSEVRLVNRTAERAQQLAEAFGAGVRPGAWSEAEAALAGAGLLVNTTTLGMGGQPPLELPLARLPDDAVVYDLVYNPLETPLLAAARTRGLRAVDGLGMLLHQARAGFALWFGVEPSVDAELRAAVLAG